MHSLKDKIKKFWEITPPGPHLVSEDIEKYSKEYFDEILKTRDSSEPFRRDFIAYNGYPNKKILEIGCGAGTDISLFAIGGAKVTGVDYTYKAACLSKKRFEVYKLKGNFLETDAENLPFKDNYFDLVYSYGVLHHTENINKAVEEIYRVLKPAGEIIIVLYNKESFYYYKTLYEKGILEKELLNSTEKEITSKYSENRSGCPVTNYFSSKEAENLFSKFIGVSSEIHQTTIYPFIAGTDKINNIKDENIRNFFEKALEWQKKGELEWKTGRYILIRGRKQKRLFCSYEKKWEL